MIKKKVTIGLTSGLEARPVAMLVQIASQFDSSIYIECQDSRVNAKSIMGMMTLGVNAGDDVLVSADGTDQDSAVMEIEKYLTQAQ